MSSAAKEQASEAHPLDFDSLQRGDLIPNERLYRIFGKPELRDDPEAFRFECLKFCGRLSKERPDIRFKIKNRVGIKVCSSQEALEAAIDGAKSAVRVLKNESVRIRSTVHPHELEPELVPVLDVNTRKLAAQWQGAVKEGWRVENEHKLAKQSVARPELPGGTAASDDGVSR